MVVKSVRDRIRNRFSISAAEVALQDLHQRARIGVAVVSADEKTISPILEEVVTFIEQEATLLGWSHELIHVDESTEMQMPHLDFQG